MQDYIAPTHFLGDYLWKMGVVLIILHATCAFPITGNPLFKFLDPPLVYIGFFTLLVQMYALMCF